MTLKKLSDFTRSNTILGDIRQNSDGTYTYWELGGRESDAKKNKTFETLKEMQKYVVDKQLPATSSLRNNMGASLLLYVNAVNPLVLDCEGRKWNELDIISDAIKGLRTTNDYAEYAKKQGYDSVIFDDVIDMDYRSAVESEPSQVVAVFDSNQVKSLDNENPTKSEDIRYSLDVTTTYVLDEEYSPFIDDDIAETKESKETFYYLR